MNAAARAHEDRIVIVGGGPAGSILASLLAQRGADVLLLERDLHPREHVGESLTPSVNAVLEEIGFIDKMEEAGFVHKPGAAWTAPQAPVGRFVAIRLNEFPIPGATRNYAYNVERDAFDAMLLGHARGRGASVVEGVRVEKVLFDGERAVGVRAVRAERQEDFPARIVVDASGRRCLLASQLGLKKKDAAFNQFAIYSWFAGVEPNPPGTTGMLFLHFLGLDRAWAWQIPLRDRLCSVGIVTEKSDWKNAGTSREEFVAELVARNLNLAHNLRNARRVQPWKVEGDFSYRVKHMKGPGWLLVGDALRFVDPVFSTGVDVAGYSALFASEAVLAVLDGEDEEQVFKEYESRITDGVDAWYELISLFYGLQNLFTFFAVTKATRENVVRILQGNLYQPEALERARQMVSIMKDAHRKVLASPSSLLRPGALARDA